MLGKEAQHCPGPELPLSHPPRPLSLSLAPKKAGPALPRSELPISHLLPSSLSSTRPELPLLCSRGAPSLPPARSSLSPTQEGGPSTASARPPSLAPKKAGPPCLGPELPLFLLGKAYPALTRPELPLFLLGKAGPICPFPELPLFYSTRAPSLPPARCSLSPTRSELPICTHDCQPRIQLGVRGLAPGFLRKK